MGDAPREAKTGLLELDDPTVLDDPPATDVMAMAELESGAARVPTIVPTFDPSQYAAQLETRERMQTTTDECALEQARLQSLPSERPPSAALGADEQVAILSARLAPLWRVPVLAKEMAQLGALLEDPKAAYVLGFVDGLLPLETIIDVTGLPRLETMTVLDRMVSQSIVIFEDVAP